MNKNSNKKNHNFTHDNTPRNNNPNTIDNDTQHEPSSDYHKARGSRDPPLKNMKNENTHTTIFQQQQPLPPTSACTLRNGIL